ncbi:hypothetical protein QUF88_25885 [Bacillus sp. DX1.1]|uniref:hypothetical protein n=1 Tax=unclassified Bacillus (in: firmicutes) TaxID=185979 RepID=UPI0025707673|nr:MULTISPECIES: hypothetical protein [unclassified Bacillus (in: firmicutes)]MDM5157119.1 hypothetical protein [Bacillus sp. DX1.1]WJE81354.1 hypothetical protein QRE67_23425 [Bacillus sp. DX3.1]
MKRSFSLLFLILLCLGVAGCAEKKDEASVLEYNGRALKIGVIGEPPNDTFRNIKFVQVKLDEMKEKSGEVDGFLVMKEYFEPASEDKYTDLFLTLKKPVFFIGLKDKPYTIFIEKDLDYNNAQADKAMMYTQGFVNLENGEGQFWGTGLYNDTISEQSLHNMYIYVFQTIADYLSKQ